MGTSNIAVILWNIIEIVFWIYLIMLFLRILASWIPELQGTKILQFVSFYTDPYLNFFRQFIPPLGMIDISPIVAFLCLGVIEHTLKWIVVTIFG